MKRSLASIAWVAPWVAPFVVAVACSRSREGGDSKPNLAPTIERPAASANPLVNAPPLAAPPPSPTDPFADDPRAPPPIETSPSTITIGSETISSSWSTPGTPGATDPFWPSIESLRARATPCFAPLPAATYAVTLTVYVTPSGRVTRVELAPGNVSDAAVLACIRQAAETATFPTSNDARSILVDVRVQGR